MARLRPHRRTLAARLGRRLAPYEYAVHLNGDKTDDAPENLGLRLAIKPPPSGLVGDWLIFARWIVDNYEKEAMAKLDWEKANERRRRGSEPPMWDGPVVGLTWEQEEALAYLRGLRPEDCKSPFLRSLKAKTASQLFTPSGKQSAVVLKIKAGA